MRTASRYPRMGGMWVLLVLLLAGCIGGKVPSEQILRISSDSKPIVISRQEKADQAIENAPLVVMEDLTAFPALDRNAVMLSHGRVLTPSSRWYWEGAPAAITGACIAASLQGRTEVTLVWPYRNRLEHQAMLTGRVEAFEVRTDAMEMLVRIRLALWTPRGRSLLLTRVLTSAMPLRSVAAQDIAEAASRCMQELSGAAADWLCTDGRNAIRAGQ